MSLCKRLLTTLFVVLVVQATSMACCTQPERSRVRAVTSRDLVVNLDHLNELYDPKTEGWWEFWSYAGGVMGHVNLDDTARAAITYINYYLSYGDEEALEYARHALNFVLKMQHDDGRFYLYVEDREQWVRKELGTGDWFGRAVHALGMGYKVFSRLDKEYAERLYEAILRARRHFKGIESVYTISHVVMGLCYLYEAREEPWILSDLRYLCGKLVTAEERTKALVGRLQRGFDVWRYFDTTSTYAPGLPVQALALAGKTLNDERLLVVAREVAEHLFVHIAIALDYMYSADVWYEWDKRPSRFPCPPIIPATITKAYSLLALSHEDAYEREAFSVMAGLYASWFLGNNPLGTPVYDAEHGYVYDGVHAGGMNTNSGCEATEIALDALIYVDRNSVSEKYAFSEDLFALTPVYVDEYSLRGEFELAFSETYSASKGVLLREGGYAVVDLAGLDLERDAFYKLILLVREGDATVEVRYNETTLKTIRITCFEPTFMPVAALPHPAGGTVSVRVERGTLLIDDVLFVPTIEYKLVRVSSEEYLLLALRLAQGRSSLSFNVSGAKLYLEFDGEGRLVRVLSDRDVEFEGTGRELTLSDIKRIVLDNEHVIHLLLFPLPSKEPGTTIRVKPKKVVEEKKEPERPPANETLKEEEETPEVKEEAKEAPRTGPEYGGVALLALAVIIIVLALVIARKHV